jgi:hypothetical protein
MKNIFKIFLAFGLLVFVSACDSLDLDEQAINPNSITPENAEINLVLNSVELDFATFMDEVSDETMPYVRMTALDGGNRFDNQDGPQSFDFMWELAYAEIIPDANLVILLANENGLTLQGGIAAIIKAQVMLTLVDLFGDVPYSKAFLGTGDLNPTADTGESIYEAAIGLLVKAAADLENPVGETNDLYYDGDASKWIKLANSLKLKAYLNTGDVSQINALITLDNFISTTGDDFQFQYGTNRSTPDSRHPYYSDGYENGGPSWYMSNYYMWTMFGEKFTEDPRLRYYFYRQDCDESDEDFFTLDCQTLPYPPHFPPGLPWCTASSDFGDPSMSYAGYWGRDAGNDDGIPPDDLKRTTWGLYPAGGKFDADDCSQVSNMGVDGGAGGGIQPIMLSSYVDFMRAEAALVLGTADDAAVLLESGVTKSIDKVMGFKSLAAVDPAFEPTADDILDYVTEVNNKYANAASADGKLDILMKEYLIALQGNGLEAYNGYRRTCMPSNMQPLRLPDPSSFARSFWYPASYVNRNSNATQKTGVIDPIFWDTKPADCAQ